MQAGLIIKYNFSVNAMPKYEKIGLVKSHNHIHIEGMNGIIAFSDSRIEEIIKYIEEKYNVFVMRHSFILHCIKSAGFDTLNAELLMR